MFFVFLTGVCWPFGCWLGRIASSEASWAGSTVSEGGTFCSRPETRPDPLKTDLGLSKSVVWLKNSVEINSKVSLVSICSYGSTLVRIGGVDISLQKTNRNTVLGKMNMIKRAIISSSPFTMTVFNCNFLI